MKQITKFFRQSCSLFIIIALIAGLGFTGSTALASGIQTSAKAGTHFDAEIVRGSGIQASAKAGTHFDAEIVRASGIQPSVNVKTHYVVECYDKDGKLKWTEDFYNIVVTAGLNKLLDATFKTGLTTPAWYVGLKDTGTPVAADTMASHASWAAIAPFSDGTLPALVLGTVSGGSVSNSASKASFSINATDDIYGAYLTDNNAVGGTTGILYGVGDFSAVKSVTSGDTLNVTMTLTISAP